MQDNIVTFPGSPSGEKAAASLVQTEYGPSRSRNAVATDIAIHVKARRSYGKAVAWEAAAQDEGLPPYRIEEARANTAMAYREMEEAARHLLICVPTDPKALVDLLLYLEQNFSVLPQEISNHGNNSRSLALDLLRTVRLSLRQIAKYDKGIKAPL